MPDLPYDGGRKRMMKKITLGILANVDAGKTTLSEALLYKAGKISTPGRVDKGNSFLDANPLERSRGITIFSKQTNFVWKDTKIYLIDTPGHAELAAEMERTLPALDCAILVISANEGIGANTYALRKLLEKHEIPTVIFINKMDLSFRKREDLMHVLRENFGNGCVDFGDGKNFFDDLSLASEKLTEAMLEKEVIEDDDIARAVVAREIFPCYFGTALETEGVEELLNGIGDYIDMPDRKEGFGARIFKIARDEKGQRLTFMKITGGKLSVRGKIGDEKVSGIRMYQGERYVNADGVSAGDLCAVTGLENSFVGQGLGFEKNVAEKKSESYLLYDVILPEEVGINAALADFMKVSEEYPELNVEWNKKTSSIGLRMTGRIQMEILKTIVKERFGYQVEFSEGKILYRETVPRDIDAVEGIGCVGSRKNFAEVHLLVEAAPRGNGNSFFSVCDEAELSRNHQNLILSYLEEDVHRGVHYGYPVTDVKVTLVAAASGGTCVESGELREATLQALRQGLAQIEGVLLEPFFEFHLEVPQEHMGRALSDIAKMSGHAEEPETSEKMSAIKGKAPVAEIKDYINKVNSYTSGRGRITLFPSGYDICHNEDEVERAGGDVSEYLMTASCDRERLNLNSRYTDEDTKKKGDENVSEETLKRIFEKTYGPVDRKREERRNLNKRKPPRKTGFEEINYRVEINKLTQSDEKYLFIDGYNLIYEWDELRKLSESDFEAARERLIEILRNYAGYTGEHVILVFDAYNVKGGTGSKESSDPIEVVYTEEAETADMYIEKVTHGMAGKNRVRVVTSDGMEQLMIMGHGALRISSREFVEDVRNAEKDIRRNLNNAKHKHMG